MMTTMTFEEWLDVGGPDVLFVAGSAEGGQRCMLTCDRDRYAEAQREAGAARLQGIPVGSPTAGPESPPASPPLPLSPLEYEALLDTIAAGDVAEELARQGMGDTYLDGEGDVLLVGQGAATRVRTQLLPLVLAVKAEFGGRIVGGGVGAWGQEVASMPPSKPLAQIMAEGKKRMTEEARAKRQELLTGGRGAAGTAGTQGTTGTGRRAA